MQIGIWIYLYIQLMTELHSSQEIWLDQNYLASCDITLTFQGAKYKYKHMV